MTNAQTPQNPMSDDALLDLATQEALGTLAAADAAVLAQHLPRADETTRRQARELRETVSRLAAASPYMEPPARLRGALLLATAPANFKMADYQRKAETSPRLLRWGMIAAVCFLTASAWYNTTLQSRIKQQDQQLAGMQTQMTYTGAALGSMVNPDTDQIMVNTKDGKPFGKAFVNQKTNIAVVVVSENVAPPTQPFELVLTRDGKSVAYKTIWLKTGAMPSNSAPGAPSTELNNVQPDRPTFKATLGGH